MNNDIFIHPSSYVDDSTLIGDGTKIWHYCHIMSNASFGESCTLGQNVFVAGNVVIGHRVKIQNNVSIYEGVVLEDDVFCGPSVVFTNVKTPRSRISRQDKYEKTFVRTGATLGANSTIVCGITIGKFAFVSAGAVVTKDVPDYALVVGTPARHIGWVCACGVRLQEKDDTFQCGECGEGYSLTGSELSTTKQHKDLQNQKTG